MFLYIFKRLSVNWCFRIKEQRWLFSNESSAESGYVTGEDLIVFAMLSLSDVNSDEKGLFAKGSYWFRMEVNLR